MQSSFSGNTRTLFSTVTCVSALALSACSSGGGGGGGGTGVTASVQIGSGTALWSPATSREPGSTGSFSVPSDLSAYRVLAGATSGVYTEDFLIDKVNFASEFTNTTVVVNNIPVGTYFYVVTAVDTEGRESLYSTEQTMTVN